jgi:hypothetical protein
MNCTIHMVYGFVWPVLIYSCFIHHIFKEPELDGWLRCAAHDYRHNLHNLSAHDGGLVLM